MSNKTLDQKGIQKVLKLIRITEQKPTYKIIFHCLGFLGYSKTWKNANKVREYYETSQTKKAQRMANIHYNLNKDSVIVIANSTIK